MSGTIFLGDDEAWPVSGWLYRWVVEDLKKLGLSAEGQDQLDEALAVQALDLRDLSGADRELVVAALGQPQIDRFTIGLQPGFDPTAAIETLRELSAMVAKSG